MPVTAPRRIGISSAQSNAGLSNTALEQQKKSQEASRTRTRNVAVGVITVAALATAAYLGRGYIFGKAPNDIPGLSSSTVAATTCKENFISSYAGTVDKLADAPKPT